MGKRIWTAAAIACALLWATVASAGGGSAGTAFTWQGRLLDGGTPVDGSVDLKFRLYDAETLGLQVGTEQVATNAQVVDGQLTIDIDFGTVFDGTALWIEIDVRSPHDPSDTAAYTPLSPRQPVMAVPYALYAMGVDPAATPFFFNGSNAVFGGGNVGIGTSTPVYALEVVGSIATDTNVLVSNPNNALANVSLGWSNDVSTILVGGSGPGSTNGFDIQGSDNTSLLRIAGSGKIGIGTNTPAHQLHVRNAGGGHVAFLENSDPVGLGVNIMSDKDPLRIGNVGDVTGSLFLVDDIGRVGIGTTSPAAHVQVHTTNNSTSLLAQNSASSASDVFGVKATVINTGAGAGSAIFGHAMAAYENGILGRAEGAGDSAGVRGEHTAVSGNGVGVYGEVTSSTGYAAYFTGGRNYFGGNVGVGTTAPVKSLHVVNTGTDHIAQFENTNPAGYGMIIMANKDPLRIGNAGDPFGNLFIVEDNGEVGIGTTSPGARLDVVGIARVESQFVIQNPLAGTEGGQLVLGDPGETLGGQVPNSWNIDVNQTDLRFFRGGGTVAMLMTDTGNIGIGTPTPNATLKVVSQTSVPDNNNTAEFLAVGIGPNPSHVHWGATGDWYIRSADSAGKVILQDFGGKVGIGTALPEARLQVESTDSHAIQAIADPGQGVAILAEARDLNQPNTGTGVSATGGKYGVSATGASPLSAPGTRYGVFGTAYLGDTNYGIFGSATALSGQTAYAVYSGGNAHIQGTLSKTGGAFRIDHPLDPENKELWHSFVESPDMMNIYNGNIVTDDAGYATVIMPDWFEALNREFRYQLTVIDEADNEDFVFAKVVEKIANNEFTIRTSEPWTEVSWMVTGIRHDRWAEANRIPTEIEKRDQDKGLYLSPDAYGVSPDRSIDWGNMSDESKEILMRIHKQSTPEIGQSSD